MERFLQRHAGRISGVLSGFDRILFRGALRSLSYLSGADKILGNQHVLYKDFGAFARNTLASLCCRKDNTMRRSELLSPGWF